MNAMSCAHFIGFVGTMVWRGILFGLVVGWLLAPAARAQISDCFMAPAGLTAWWPLDDATNQVTVLDWAGSHHGTAVDGGGNPVAIGSPLIRQLPDPAVLGGALKPVVVDPTTVPVRGALFLEGGAVRVPSGPDLDIGVGGLTICLWVWPAGGQQRPLPLVEKYDPLSRSGYSLYLDRVGNDQFVLKLNLNGSVLTGPVVPASAGTNDWRFVVAGVIPPGMVVMGVADMQGNWSTNAAIVWSYTTSNQAPLWIGHSVGPAGGGSPVRAAGLGVDEVEIFNRGLSPSEVMWIFGMEFMGVRKCATSTGTAQVCIRKFEDLNRNGIMDPDERGLAGWNFVIYPPPLFLGTNLVTTEDGGLVCVAVGAPGTYNIVELAEPGWTNTTPVMQSIRVVPGQVTNLFFGNAPEMVGPPRICVTKFYDRNGNRVPDQDEMLLPGWTVQVLDSSGAVIRTLVTSNEPVCVDLPGPGTYTIFEVLPPPLGNWQLWVPTYPPGGGFTNVTINAGQVVNLGFGNRLQLKILDAVVRPDPTPRLVLQVAAVPGTTIQLQYRERLDAGAPWQDWGDPVTITNTLTSIEVSLESLPDQGYFRVVEQ